MIDPRIFLGIGGPTPQQQMLAPGFRPPGPGPGAPMMQPPQMPQIGIPGMGLMSKAGDNGTFGNQTGDALKQTAAGTSVAETINPFSTNPTGNITETGATQPGSFWSFMRGLIPPAGYTGGGAGGGWAP